MTNWVRSMGFVLLGCAAMVWFAPGWNGFFFPSTPMEPWQGQLIAAVLFVGGLIVIAITSLRR